MEKEKKQKKTLSFWNRIGLSKNTSFFIENVSILLSAGMTLNAVMGSISEGEKSRRMKKVLDSISNDLNDGSSFHDSLDRTGIFSGRVLSLVKVGEESGRLKENLEVLVLQNEKEALFKSKVRSSLMYMVIIFTLAAVIGLGTAWFTLPKIASFFNELDADLPLATRIIIYSGNFFISYGYIVVPFLAGIIIASFYFLFSFPKTKFIGHAILFHIPVVKNLIKQVEISRFGYLLGTMLDSGMPVIDAIYSIKDTSTFKNYQKFYLFLGERIENGESLQNVFRDYKKIESLFPAYVIRMIDAGEKSGKLPDVLFRIGGMFENKTEETARNLPIILEPVLLFTIGLGVAFLAVGIILPIYSVTNIF